MQKASIAINASSGETIASPSLPTTATATIKATVTANQSDLHRQTELIDSNMEETCPNVGTDNANESKNVVIRSDKSELNAFERDVHKTMPDSVKTTATTMTTATITATATATAVTLTTTMKIPPPPPPPKNSHSESATKNKVVKLKPPSVETICDDISSTTEDIKQRLKHVQVRSNSTGKLYQSSRRVSFPENDSELVTGYLEPADPWACGK